MKPSLRFPKSALSCAAAVAAAATLVLASTATLAADSGAAGADAEAAALAARITVGGCAPPGGAFAAGDASDAALLNPIPIEVDDARLIAVAATDPPAGEPGETGDAGAVVASDLDPAEALKRAYLACETAAMEHVLDGGDAARCSQIYEALLRDVFGGRYEDLHAWWKGLTETP